jgi:hypothetical protein
VPSDAATDTQNSVVFCEGQSEAYEPTGIANFVNVVVGNWNIYSNPTLLGLLENSSEVGSYGTIGQYLTYQEDLLRFETTFVERGRLDGPDSLSDDVSVWIRKIGRSALSENATTAAETLRFIRAKLRWVSQQIYLMLRRLTRPTFPYHVTQKEVDFSLLHGFHPPHAQSKRSPRAARLWEGSHRATLTA